MLDDKVAVTLTLAQWQQILDGLRARQESWDNTVLFFQDALPNTVMIEEATDEAEAQLIADSYAELIRAIELQTRKG